MFFLGNIQHAGDQIMDGLGVARGHFLYEAFDLRSARDSSRLDREKYRRPTAEQGGFSAAIAADQADVFACVEIERHLIEQCVTIPGIGNFVEVKQRHEPLFGRNFNRLKPDCRPHGFAHFGSPQLAHVPAGFGIHRALPGETLAEPGEIIVGEQEVIAREHELEIGAAVRPASRNGVAGCASASLSMFRSASAGATIFSSNLPSKGRSLVHTPRVRADLQAAHDR